MFKYIFCYFLQVYILDAVYSHVRFLIRWELVIDIPLQMDGQMWDSQDWSVDVNKMMFQFITFLWI